MPTLSNPFGQSGLPIAAPRLGRKLLADGAISATALERAMQAQRRGNTRLGELLLARGMVAPDALDRALAAQAGLARVSLSRDPPAPTLAAMADPLSCLRLGFVPWRKASDGGMIIAVSRMERMAEIRAALPAGQRIAPVYAPPEDIQTAIAGLYRDTLRLRAETRCPEAMSCRSTRGPGGAALLMLAAALIATCVLAPALAGLALTAIGVLALAMNTTLRLTGALTTLRLRRRGDAPADIADPPATIARLPSVSILVPLHREAAVLPRLIERLKRIDYPRELLEICLVLEEGDTETRDAARALRLPPWIRVIPVPDAPLKTKPRAMNYALDFCRGSILGVYDAEDAPEPGQIRQVVERFHSRGPTLGCVQGVLDYYNCRRNWLARCFTVEYATWFRLILPGLEALGLPIPLGGTTLFVRRDVLEQVGAWDAHNVTEDADLGMRLARHGYRCEFVATVTHEEATCHPWRWVRQRSRWLKGFAMTWATHMRAPRRLAADLGWRGFLAFQVFFLGTVAGFAAAPVLWSFWGWALTGHAPLGEALPVWAYPVLGTAFVASELTIMGLGLVATAGPAHRHLWPWVPTMPLYFPLATVAAYKALYELLRRPFFWDKTDHGHSQPEPAPAPAAAGMPG